MIPRNPRYRFLLVIAAALGAGCSSQREGGGSTGMQNLTAHFNVLYNANEQFKIAETDLLAATSDDYTLQLPVYKQPPMGSATPFVKALDSVSLRANTIISQKAKSDYVDDAWMLKGKVEFLRGDFFTAAEFFDYVHKTWYDDKLLRQQALTWKARALMRLNDMEHAAVAMDSVLKHLVGPNRELAAAYAAEAQFNIQSGNDGNAADMLRKALKAGSTKQNNVRWKYVLAQLEEKLGQPAEAVKHYGEVMKSNASFEMAFNATLNRMRLSDAEGATTNARIAALRKLAKQYKNRDFLDQVYYRIGELYLNDGKRDLALQNFQRGLDNSTVNRNQKGTIYLKLADLYFADADYVRAKAYYDSTLTAFPPGWPSYETIRLKSVNLDFLATRFKEIAYQDTLQVLAKLPADELTARAGAIVRDQLRRTQSAAANQPGMFTAAIDQPGKTGDGKFYFNNATAIAQGAIDFRKRWGNRKLDDNWRRSAAPGDMQQGQLNQPPVSAIQPTIAGTQPEETMIRELVAEVPLTPVQLEASKSKLVSAYFDVAGFYKDELRDENEAIRMYGLLLDRYPENAYQPAIYFNLYRLYNGKNAPQAAVYRDKLLNEFPESLYAKVLLDPDYAKKVDQRALALNTAYTDTYNAYSKREYAQTITLATNAKHLYGPSPLSAQFDYLAALAAGHRQKIGPFEDSLRNIVTAYPTDQVVVPMIRQQLDFIKANRDMLEQRPVALIDRGSGEPAPGINEPERPRQTAQQQPVVTAQNPPPVKTETPVNASQAEPVKQEPPKLDPVKTPVAETPAPVVTQKPAVSEVTPPKPKPLYDLPETGTYYVVINVTDGSLNLNPSRFGLGQYIRSNYARTGIGHQTKELNADNQLVYIGKFATLNDALAWRLHLLPLLKDIMKIPAEKYDTFVITGPELDKLNDRGAVERYAEFFRGLN